MEKLVFYLFLAKRSPSVPIRLMADCLMLKHLYNPGDHHLPEFRVRSVELNSLREELLIANFQIIIIKFRFRMLNGSSSSL